MIALIRWACLAVVVAACFAPTAFQYLQPDATDMEAIQATLWVWPFAICAALIPFATWRGGKG